MLTSDSGKSGDPINTTAGKIIVLFRTFTFTGSSVMVY